MSSNLPAKQQKQTTIANVMSAPERLERIRSSLSGMMEPDTFINHCIMAINNPDKPEIRETSLASQAECILTLATLGLLPSMNQAALIVRGNRLTVLPQWQGYKAIMLRHPDIKDIKHNLVHVKDKDNFAVVDGIPEHRYNPLDPGRTISGPDDILGGYLTIHYRDGRVEYHFVTVAYIEKCRSCAKSQNVWKQWYEKMAIKTMYRDCYSQRIIPVDPNVAHRIEQVNRYDDQLLGNDPKRLEPPSSAADRVAAALRDRQEQATTNGYTLDVEDTQVSPNTEDDGDYYDSGVDIDGDVIDEPPPKPPTGSTGPAGAAEVENPANRVAQYLRYIEAAEKIKDVQEFAKLSAKDEYLAPADVEKVQSAARERIYSIKNS